MTESFWGPGAPTSDPITEALAAGLAAFQEHFEKILLTPEIKPIDKPGVLIAGATKELISPNVEIALFHAMDNRSAKFLADELMNAAAVILKKLRDPKLPEGAACVIRLRNGTPPQSAAEQGGSA